MEEDLSHKLSIAVLSLVLLSDFVRAADTCHPETWQSDIDKFAAADMESSRDSVGVVFVGSSSIRMWDLEKSFPEKGYLNRGFGGSAICDSTHYFDELIAKHEPRLVVFYAGDNDIAGGKSPQQVQKDFQAFATQFREKLPEAELVYISIKPSIARWKLAEKMREANSIIESLCDKYGPFTFVDVWPVMLNEKGEPRKDIFLEDGLHMNDKGYELWAELLKEHLK
jgi:lysophospholipase L1-like esterase